MRDTIKEYNNYLSQIEMILHPNLFNAFMNIHNKLIEEEVENAKSFKPSKEWIKLKQIIDDMRKKEPAFKSIYMKELIKQIDVLPNERW